MTLGGRHRPVGPAASHAPRPAVRKVAAPALGGCSRVPFWRRRLTLRIQHSPFPVRTNQHLHQASLMHDGLGADVGRTPERPSAPNQRNPGRTQGMRSRARSISQVYGIWLSNEMECGSLPGPRSRDWLSPRQSLIGNHRHSTPASMQGDGVKTGRQGNARRASRK